MKKRILTAITALMLCLTGFSAQAEDDVSVSFRIGDSILQINGRDVEVEKPFIKGEGTTLVPLRVITEAFGAEVLWDDTEKKITLNYPDVNVVLQIGNSIAEVNTHTETLAEAPVLTENGVTMVPFRFISETFGAEVTWNDGLITATKYADADFGKTVEGIADSEKIGDSYYGWTMDNPKSMIMSDRIFDGSYVEFSDEEGNCVEIIVYSKNEYTLSFEDDFNTSKASLSGSALIRQDKKTDENGNNYYILQVKDDADYFEVRHYHTANKVYEVLTYFTTEDNAERDAFFALSDSFRLEAPSEDTYDLSDVEEDGTRIFSDEKYKVSMKIPAGFYQSETGENEFIFLTEDTGSQPSAVHIAIYSKTAETTAQALAESDRNTREANANSALCVLSPVSSEIVDGTEIYSYTHTISGSQKNDGVTLDSFFEKGEYLYNVAVQASTAEDAKEIFATLQTEELDADKIGTLIRNENSHDETVNVKYGSWSFAMPANWSTIGSASDTGVICSNMQSLVSCGILPYDNSTSNFKNYVKDMIKQLTSAKEITVEKDISSVTANGMTFYSYTLKDVTNGDVNYLTTYAALNNGKIILFMMSENEVFYGGMSGKDLLSMVSSFTMK